MADEAKSQSVYERLTRRLLACFSLGWAVDLVNLANALRQFARGHQPGLYEILDYDTTLELLDKRGKKTIFRKHQRVKFLQNVIAFQHYAWGEGDIFASYTCTPGVVVDRYQESDRWNILISLRATKQRGDVEDFYIERTVENEFTHEGEWCQVEIRNPTRKLRMAVILPKARRVLRTQIPQRSRHNTIALGPDHKQELSDGRQMMVWESENIRLLEIYTLKWWC